MASPLTYTTFLLRYPEFAAQPQNRIEYWIADTINELDEKRWGDWLEKGHAALVAHNLCLSEYRQNLGSGGLITNNNIKTKKVGDVSITYGESTLTGEGEAWYQLTPYGQEYWRLVGLVGIGAVVPSSINAIEGL